MTWKCRTCEKDFEDGWKLIHHTIKYHGMDMADCIPVSVLKEISEMLLTKYLNVWKMFVKKC